MQVTCSNRKCRKKNYAVWKFEEIVPRKDIEFEQSIRPVDRHFYFECDMHGVEKEEVINR
jgi:hypothetical protein